MIISRTILAALIAAIPTVLLMFGITYEISIGDQAVLVNALMILVSLVGVVIFRYKAKTDLETKGPLVTPPAKAVDTIPPVVIKAADPPVPEIVIKD